MTRNQISDRPLRPTLTMTKSTKGKGKALKLGAPDHFTGSRLAFLVSQGTLYQQALDSKSITTFYDKVAVDFVTKFGFEKPCNLEPEGDLTDSDDGIDDNAGVDSSALTLPSKKEIAEQPELFMKLRTVS